MPYEALKTEYLNYLMNKLQVSGIYYDVCKILQDTAFIPILPMDENRSYECLELRKEFIEWSGNVPENIEILNYELGYRGTGTMLELLVVLTFYIHYNLLESEYDAEPSKWFLEMLENCGILPWAINGWLDDEKAKNIKSILSIINMRRFNWDGEGSFFPIRFPQSPHCDQRYEELIVQANNYIADKYDIC